MKYWILQKLSPWLAALAALAIWHLAVVLFKIEQFVLPSPVETFIALYQFRGPLMSNALFTLYTTLVGFGISVFIGMLLGIAIGEFRIVYNALYPLLIAFNSVPKVAIVPILVLWFGIGSIPAIITAFVLSFFPIVVNVATGLATVEPELLDILRSLGATRTDMLIKIGIPRSLPYFFASLKVAITLSFVGAVIAEIVAGDKGVGHVMLVAGATFNVPLVFAGLIVVGIMGTGMYVLFALVEQRLTGWSVRGTNNFAIGG